MTTLRAVAEVAQRHDLIVVSDEIYDRLVYGAIATCPSRHCPGCAIGRSRSAASPRPMR